VTYGHQVNVFGLVVSHGDIVHADEHGAVAFPAHYVTKLEALAERFVAAEAPIIEACKKGGLTFQELSRLYLAR
jgi:regulator of RNase E activity RraA